MAYNIFSDLYPDIKDHIANNMSTYISLINAENSDLTLSGIRESVLGYDDPYSATKYPILYVYPEPVEMEHVSTGSDSINPMIDIIIADKDGRKTLDRTIRWGDTIINLIKSDWSLGGAVDTSFIEAAYFYPPATADNIGIVNVQIKINKQLNF